MGGYPAPPPQNNDAALLADKVAQSDATLTLLVNAVRAAESWEAFKVQFMAAVEKIDLEGAEAVVDSGQVGYIIKYQVLTKGKAETEYVRNDDGKAAVFKDRIEAEHFLARFQSYAATQSGFSNFRIEALK